MQTIEVPPCTCIFLGGDPVLVESLRRVTKSIQHSKHFEFQLDWPGIKGYLRQMFSHPNKRVLLRLETPTTSPLTYSAHFTKKFRYIFELGVGDENHWPLDFIIPTMISEEKNNTACLMIASDKLSLSEGELYSLRRECFDKLPIQVLGNGWDESLPRRLLVLVRTFTVALLSRNINLNGAIGWLRQRSEKSLSVKVKHDHLSMYATSLVIENDLGKTTEKLYDALIAGCNIVYVGPKLDFNRFAGLNIIQAEPNLESIREALEKANNATTIRSSELRMRLEENFSKDFTIENSLAKSLTDLHQRIERIPNFSNMNLPSPVILN
jgi:hypothetical protein